MASSGKKPRRARLVTIPGAAILGLSILALSSATAERVQLRDGTTLNGRILSVDANEIRIRTESGVEQSIPQDQVARIDYSPAIAANQVRVILRDGGQILGVLEEQTEDALNVTTTLGILTIRRSDVARIEALSAGPGAIESQPPTVTPLSPTVAPVAPAVAAESADSDDNDRIRLRLRAAYFAPVGLSGKYRGQFGGGLASEMRLRRSPWLLGLDVSSATLPGAAEENDQLSFLRSELFIGWRASMGSIGEFTLRAGGGAAAVRRSFSGVNQNFVSDYFLRRGDFLGYYLSTLDLDDDLRRLSGIYYLARSDTVSYILVDRRNFRTEESGFAPSASIGASVGLRLGESYGLAFGLSGGLIGEQGANLGLLEASVEFVWRH